jgi:hypothetical protein
MLQQQLKELRAGTHQVVGKVSIVSLLLLLLLLLLEIVLD